MATTKDGTIVGAIFAIALLVGIIRVEVLSQKVDIWTLLAIGLLVGFHRSVKGGSLSPPVDGFVTGVGLMFSSPNVIVCNITQRIFSARRYIVTHYDFHYVNSKQLVIRA